MLPDLGGLTARVVWVSAFFVSRLEGLKFLGIEGFKVFETILFYFSVEKLNTVKFSERSFFRLCYVWSQLHAKFCQMFLSL